MLSDLIKRVEEATGPNYQLECDIAQEFDAQRLAEGLHAPNYTSSLDAVVALVERELPGAFWCVAVDDTSTLYEGSIQRSIDGKMRWQECLHITPALALLLAFLRSREKTAE